MSFKCLEIVLEIFNRQSSRGPSVITGGEGHVINVDHNTNVIEVIERGSVPPVRQCRWVGVDWVVRAWHGSPGLWVVSKNCPRRRPFLTEILEECSNCQSNEGCGHQPRCRRRRPHRPWDRRSRWELGYISLGEALHWPSGS